MEKLDFEAMSLDDLWALHERIGKLLSERIVAEKRQLEARLLRLGARKATRGVGADALEAKAPRRKYPKVFPKYQNSKTPFETWSGRGKQPRWLVSALKAGNKVEDFAIPNSIRAKSKAAAHSRHD